MWGIIGIQQLLQGETFCFSDSHVQWTRLWRRRRTHDVAWRWAVLLRAWRSSDVDCVGGRKRVPETFHNKSLQRVSGCNGVWIGVSPWHSCQFLEQKVDGTYVRSQARVVVCCANVMMHKRMTPSYSISCIVWINHPALVTGCTLMGASHTFLWNR